MTYEPIPDDIIMRGAVRIRFGDALSRVASLVWWGTYTAEDALTEIRGQAYLMAYRMKVDPALIDDAVVQWLDEELARHESEHAASHEAMKQAALEVLRRNGSRAEVRRAVAQCAKDRPLLPPKHIMNAAVEAAGVEHRRAESWWKKREPVE